MRFYALLSPEGKNALSSRLTRTAPVRFLSSVASVDACLRDAGFGSILVVDPDEMSEPQLESILRITIPLDLPVLLYIGSQAECSGRVLSTLRKIDAEVVMRGAPGEHAALRRITDQGLSVGAPAQLLRRLAGRVSRLPRSLQGCVVEHFAGGEIPVSVADLCSRVEQHRRTVERYMVRVGITGIAALVDSARLARAWEEGRELRTLSLVAERADFGSARALTAICRRYVGMPYGRMRAQLTTAEFVERIACRLCTPGSVKHSSPPLGEASVVE